MHWLGKTCAVLIVIASLACSFLTAKLIAVRNSWARKSQDFSSKYDANYAKLVEARKQSTQLRDDIEEKLREWGGKHGIFLANTQVTSPDGKLAVDLGTNFRIGEKQTLHGFEVQADGNSIYRGEFIVTTAQADRSALSPTWRVRPDDVKTWQPGRWRWRTEIPSAYSKRAIEQAMSFASTDETLKDRSDTLQIQEKLIRDAGVQRKQRIAELVGGEELAQDEALPAEFRQGLTGTLGAIEEERNQVLLETDALRRKVRQKRDAVQQLQQNNEQLVQKLPQPNPEPQVSRRD